MPRADIYLEDLMEEIDYARILLSSHKLVGDVR